MKTTTQKPTTQQHAILAIAQKVLGLETLETRYSDGLDFHDMAVWRIKEALEAAFEAGQQHRKK